MKKIILVSTLLLIPFLMNVAHANETRCASIAITIAKNIRKIELGSEIKNAKFRIISSEITDEQETYIIEMHVKGQRIMTDQELTMAPGSDCILANYWLPGAG